MNRDEEVEAIQRFVSNNGVRARARRKTNTKAKTWKPTKVWYTKNRLTGTDKSTLAFWRLHGL